MIDPARLLPRRLAVTAALLAATAAGPVLATAPATAAPAAPAPAPAFPVPPLTEVAAAGTEGLDPLLALAYTMAEQEAHARGVPMTINSGYRSPEEQRAMWEEGLRTYGSPEETRRWVLPPEESTHVTGRAVDIAPREGAAWLEANGNRWGLCRTFDNEWWHFELATLPGAACPARVPDAAHR
ncbi:M15 family metallopeptidase [Nocardia grenadensis]|uniref:M15 family metallopeptidase n=1 Tax=Nocardia grenadensis TaxID=931537 RepID=UPI003D7363BF